MSIYLEIKDKQRKLFKDTNLCINNTFIDFNSIIWSNNNFFFLL